MRLFLPNGYSVFQNLSDAILRKLGLELKKLTRKKKRMKYF